MHAAVSDGADTLECRLDYLGEPPSEPQLKLLLTDPPAELIVTCRAQREGGRFRGTEEQRLNILATAAKFNPTFIDVEMDVSPGYWPDAKIIQSHHNFDRVPEDLDRIFATQEASSASVNKIAFAASGPEDALLALDLIRNAKKPTLALAMCETGVLSRILAAKVGAFGTFATLNTGAGSAPGQPTLDACLNLYRWNRIRENTPVYGVIGCPIGHSMSPAIHNAALRATDLDGVYVPLKIEPDEENFNRFMDAALERKWLNLRGLSVTIPHKENALAYIGADRCDPLAVRIGAVNTITLNEDGSLYGDNTDYAAAIDAVCNAMDISREQLAGRKVAVLGAGGVARAVVAALTHYQAETTVYNRTLRRAKALAKEFSCAAAKLKGATKSEAEILINCTSIGMSPQIEETPLRRLPSSARVVFDTIYNPMETRLLIEARAAGCLCVSGLEMFVNQAVAQFERWTGVNAPREVMRQVVVERLTGRES